MMHDKGHVAPMKQYECDKILEGLIENPNSGPGGENSMDYLSATKLHKIEDHTKSYPQNQREFEYLNFLQNNEGADISSYEQIRDLGIENSDMFNKSMLNTEEKTSSIFKNMSEFSTPTENVNQQEVQSRTMGSDHNSRNAIISSNMTNIVFNESFEKNIDNVSDENFNLTEEEKKKKTNREAQRAFRRRKEEKLKEMEAKWINSENDKKQLMNEIEDLRKLTYEMSQENRELLKKHGSSSNTNAQKVSTVNNDNDQIYSLGSSVKSNSPSYNFPDRTEYVQFVYHDNQHVINQEIGNLPDLEYTTAEGEEAMTVPKTWEYLFKRLHEKEEEGQTFDTWQVMNDMKGNEVCHGSGAAYMKSFVDYVLNQNVKEI
ncbi:hypothetical protein QEN19_002737 [Hanseniaspora menglaensis]